jgi:GABA permease
VSGISRLWDHGGFMPNGFGAVLSAMLITMFSFMCRSPRHRDKNR